MENYWAYSPTIFETTKDEIRKLDAAWEYTKEKYINNLALIKKYFKEKDNRDVVDFKFCKVPEKRNKYDNAVLLCMVLLDGSCIAKRYHNTQWLKLEL